MFIMNNEVVEVKSIDVEELLEVVGVEELNDVCSIDVGEDVVKKMNELEEGVVVVEYGSRGEVYGVIEVYGDEEFDCDEYYNKWVDSIEDEEYKEYVNEFGGVDMLSDRCVVSMGEENGVEIFYYKKML